MPMISMTTAPIPMPMAVPSGPAIGRKVVPGMTKAPQPTAHPKDSAHTLTGERYFDSCFVSVSAAAWLRMLVCLLKALYPS